MESKIKDLEITISGSISTRDCYKGLNIVNNAFNIDELDLFFSKNINIKIESMFMPGKILVFLGHYFYRLDTQGKELSVTFQEDLYDFVNKCGLAEYISKKYVSPLKIGSSVILPFSRISTQKEFSIYLKNFISSSSIVHKDDIISYISELQYNSIEHGKTQDIYIMGQMYPRKEEIDITIYDAGVGMLKNNLNTIVENVYKNYSTEEFYNSIIKKYGLNVFFIIICVCTQFSIKGLNEGGLGLWDLSKYLYENKGIIQIATDNIFINLEFNEICSKLNSNSISLNVKELDNTIVGTYISFTFST